MNRFIPNLAQLCFPFRPLLKDANSWDRREEHDKAFSNFKYSIRNVAEITHFKRGAASRIICDSSRTGLGAVLQQRENNDEWKPSHFASRCLTALESKNSTNESERLAVVWSAEQLRNYVYGTQFPVISDPKALSSVREGNRGNRTYSSRLTRWVDLLLPIQFHI